MSQAPTARVQMPTEAAAAEVTRFLLETPEAQLDSALLRWGCPPPLGNFVVGLGALRDANVVDVAMWDSKDGPQNRWPYRARVVKAGAGWQVEFIVAQCASCFGTGWLGDEDRQCDTCDGSGWGVGRSGTLDMSAFTWEPASIITGFRLETPLGSGGFGSVWRAVPEGGGDPVALKLLNGRFSDEDTARMRGDVELLAASASSSSPHIVKVLGGGTDPVPYVVMELIDGTDLGRELDRRARVAPPGRFSQGETIGIARSVASALGVLRATGIIHRDVKPANVMIDKAGVVKLADFGIAKIVGFDSVTATSQLPMSMAYAAPEVWEGHATHQSDLYALGCMLYQCLAGRPPFTGSYAEVFRKHLSAAPDLGALPADIAPSLLELLRLCLMKQGADRPANSDAVLALLECAEREVAARPTSETTVAVVAVPAHEPQGAARRSGDTATSPPNSTS